MTSHRGTSDRIVFQRTLKNPIGCSGIGLHSGSRVSMTLLPAAPGAGIVFRRTDADVEIRAHVDNVVDSRLCTVLGDGRGTTVGTVEHLMAALNGCGIDNAVVELDSAEVPAMDGSAAPFVFLIECAGILGQDVPRRAIEVLKHVEVSDGNGAHAPAATLTPGDSFSVAFEIDFDNPAIGSQELFLQLVNGSFKGEIARARTFGFEHEVDFLRRNGLARGGSLDNAVVLRGDDVLNEEGLRYDDEFVRHKVLDAVGDLYLAGAPLIGHFHGVRSGHALNHAVVRALLADTSAWRYVDLPAAEPERTLALASNG